MHYGIKISFEEMKKINLNVWLAQHINLLLLLETTIFNVICHTWSN